MNREVRKYMKRSCGNKKEKRLEDLRDDDMED